MQAHPSQLFLLAVMSRGLPKEPHTCCCAAVLYLVSGSAGERLPAARTPPNTEKSDHGRVSNEHVRSLQRPSPSPLARGLALRAKGTLSLLYYH